VSVCASPSAETTKELRLDWVAFVVARNLLILWGWHE
jgi:hypothetical protein